MAPKKPKWTPLTLGDATVFGIPSKQRKPIPIKSPDSKQESPKLQHSDSVDATQVDQFDIRLSPPARGRTAVPKPLHDDTTVSCPKPAETSGIRDHPLRTSQADIKKDLGVLKTGSSLDIFASNYTPRWLLAVNTSQAQLQPCPPFPTLDFLSYISTLVGPDFAKDVPLATFSLPADLVALDQGMTPQNYSVVWSKHLHTELTLQHLQHRAFAMYNQTLQAEPLRSGHFRLHVPGLLENAPRLDLGDVVHVRLLQPSARPHDSHVDYWLKHGQMHDAICPGFSGWLYNPCVWEINKAKEFVTLRIDNFPKSGQCNVIFFPQEPKFEPLRRAIRPEVCQNPWLRKMLFPEVMEGETQHRLSSGHFDIPWVDQLNWEQKKAVHNTFSANYGTMPYLIWGPPGTGKTKTLVEIALQQLRKPGHILICAPSDAAADTLALRLSLHLQPDELFRLNHWRRTFAEVPDALMHYTYADGSSFSLPPVGQMLKFRMVVTTCRDADLLNKARLTNISLSGLFNGVTQILSADAPRHPLHWTSLLLDEAAQATEPDALIPLTVVMPPDHVQSPQFVAAGDQFQLGPKLLSKSPLSISLFQRLFDTEVYRDHPLSRKFGSRVLTQQMLPMMRPAFTNLVRNYRSHPAILSVPSSLFYNDTLIPERKTPKVILDWPGWPSGDHWPILFKQNSSDDAYESITDGDGTGSGTLYNPGEATVALGLVLSLLQHVDNNDDDKNRTNDTPPLRQKDIMIMSPFRKQVAYLRHTFRQHDLFSVNIGPLEAFQGLESRIVVICTTRTRLGRHPQRTSHHVKIDQGRGLGVVDEPQRLNVAMTRAQEGLIVIGNAECLISTGDEQWLNFLDYVKRNGCVDTPQDYQWPALGGPYRQGRLERALVYADLGQAEADAEAGVDRGHVGLGRPRADPVSISTNRFRLRGHQKDMDEEMWQFKEIAQLHDSEMVDVILEHDEDELDASDSDDHSIDGGGEIDQDDDYDRNLKQELHRACNTQ